MLWNLWQLPSALAHVFQSSDWRWKQNGWTDAWTLGRLRENELGCSSALSVSPGKLLCLSQGRESRGSIVMEDALEWQRDSNTTENGEHWSQQTSDWRTPALPCFLSCFSFTFWSLDKVWIWHVTIFDTTGGCSLHVWDLHIQWARSSLHYSLFWGY